MQNRVAIYLLLAVTFTNGARSEEMSGNPDERGDYVEGDMVLDDEQLGLRNGVVSTKRQWKNAVVPFRIIGTFTLTQTRIIRKAIADYHEKTCVRFVEKLDGDGYTQWLDIKNGQKGCFANVGVISKVNKPNIINFDNWCFNRYGTIVHEMAHALGFYHEQSRFDRDDFITIVFQNIPIHRRSNFRKYTDAQVQHFGAPYDYDSMMHYSKTSFSDNGKAMIITKDPDAIIGQRDGFSISDLYKINKMYNCNPSPLPPDITWPATPWPNPIIPTPRPQFISDMDWRCDFESDKCGFSDEPTLELIWIRKNGETPTLETGPSFDHTTADTTKNGFYMYLESSNGANGDVAQMYSPGFTLSGKRCLRFWYHMFGNGMGNLRVYQIAKDTNRTEIWQESGNQGNMWLEAVVFVDVKQGARLIFEAEKGVGFRSDMAVDDIALQQTTADKCVPPFTPTLTTLSPHIDPKVRFYCNFDKNGCNFVKNLAYKGDWIRHKGKTPSPGTGPTADVSKLVFGRDEGYYMYIEASNYNHGDASGITSPLFSVESAQSCVSLYYHMYGTTGNGMGILDVHVVSTTTKTVTSVTKRSGNQGFTWIKSQATFEGKAGEEFKIQVIGYVGTSFASDIAIDEIKVSSGAC